MAEFRLPSFDNWITGPGWRQPERPRVGDAAVLDLATLYDGFVARATAAQQRERPDLGRFRCGPSWAPFEALARFLGAQGVDPALYLTAQFAERWRNTANGCPYPSMLLCEAAWGRWLRWSASVGRRYPERAVEGAAAEAAPAASAEAALHAVLEDGLARWRSLPLRDVPRLVVLAPGVLPPEFVLIWPEVRAAARRGAGPAVVAHAWGRLTADPGLLRYLDAWAAGNGLPGLEGAIGGA